MAKWNDQDPNRNHPNYRPRKHVFIRIWEWLEAKIWEARHGRHSQD